MPKTCIINFAENAWYPKGQKRLVDSLKSTGYTKDLLLFTSHTELGCRPHSDISHGFKTYALSRARNLGYEIVLMLDASFWAIRSVEPCLEYIENNGYLFETCGFSIGQMISDRVLAILDTSREAMLHVPGISSGIIGLDLRLPIANKFLDRWHHWSSETDTFNGPYSNDNREASADPRVIGHRHDQTMASVVIHNLGMKIGPATYMEYDNPSPGPNCCFLCRGM